MIPDEADRLDRMAAEPADAPEPSEEACKTAALACYGWTRLLPRKMFAEEYELIDRVALAIEAAVAKERARCYRLASFIRRSRLVRPYGYATGGWEMSEMKWTPGPWYPKFGNLLRVSPSGRTAVICGIHRQGRFTGRINDGEAEANTRLIAAAPELYEALQNLLDGRAGSRPAARAVLARARGEP